MAYVLVEILYCAKKPKKYLKKNPKRIKLTDSGYCNSYRQVPRRQVSKIEGKIGTDTQF